MSIIKTISVNLLILVYCSALFRDIYVECVQITKTSGVQSFQSGSPGSVTLDCQFEMDVEIDKMTVLKWFRKGKTDPLFSWILDLNFTSNNIPENIYVNTNQTIDEKLSSRSAALNLISPTTEWSGEYTCSVQSLDSHDSQTSELIVYEKAESFTMNAIDLGDNGVNITCSANGVTPEPKLSLFRITQSNDSDNNINVIEVTDNVFNQTYRTDSGQYNGFLSVKIYEDSYSSKEVTDHYECKLSIEKTNYSETKNIAIQTGWHTYPPYLGNSSSKFLAPIALVFMFLPLLTVKNIISF